MVSVKCETPGTRQPVASHSESLGPGDISCVWFKFRVWTEQRWSAAHVVGRDGLVHAAGSRSQLIMDANCPASATPTPSTNLQHLSHLSSCHLVTRHSSLVTRHSSLVTCLLHVLCVSSHHVAEMASAQTIGFGSRQWRISDHSGQCLVRPSHIANRAGFGLLPRPGGFGPRDQGSIKEGVSFLLSHTFCCRDRNPWMNLITHRCSSCHTYSDEANPSNVKAGRSPRQWAGGQLPSSIYIAHSSTLFFLHSPLTIGAFKEKRQPISTKRSSHASPNFQYF
ncbi:hypothetical protein B0I35DRAFT_254113 [Stachybotrys elegans]|uniref:Uncharacterized protein n=1 Tax=Stachybotrys elegans TaxID=80388 RepID=A0A8K0SJV3_9HYPO|nr:hypothetical protein B0I35DRAFT_254113 [Stachybotrys elegans]